MRLKKVKVLSYNEYKERKEYQNKSQRYNGWSNYETYRCNEWLENTGIDKIVEEYKTGKINYINALGQVRAEIREQLDALYYTGLDDLLGDLLEGAIYDINILELAEASLA